MTDTTDDEALIEAAAKAYYGPGYEDGDTLPFRITNVIAAIAPALIAKGRAEALREAAEALDSTANPYCNSYWLRDRAARIARDTITDEAKS